MFSFGFRSLVVMAVLTLAIAVSTAALTAEELHGSCVERHGPFYKVTSASNGFQLAQPNPGSNIIGVQVEQSTVGTLHRSMRQVFEALGANFVADTGGACKASMIFSCNSSTSSSCRVATPNCASPQGGCFDCQSARFQSRIQAKVRGLIIMSRLIEHSSMMAHCAR
jgi:hypothetical protein